MGRSDNILRAVDIVNLLFSLSTALRSLMKRKRKWASPQQKGEKTNTEIIYDEPGAQAISLLRDLPIHKINTSRGIILLPQNPRRKGIWGFAQGLVGMVFGYASDYKQIVALVEEYKRQE